jgi:DNA-binding FadR family transcriptional regulator
MIAMIVDQADSGGTRQPRSSARLPKASDVLARDIRQRILQERLQPGSRLPSEADLIDQFGVSRTTVREGLRILEVEGLIKVKRGPKGGVVVARPSEERVMNALGVLLQFNQVPLTKLLEAREVLEPPCAALAAERATTQHLEMLAAATDAMEAAAPGSSAYHAANLRFHVGLAEAAGNEVLKVFLSSMRELLEMSTSEMQFEERQLKYGVRAHRRIIDAIRARDPENARLQTLRHVGTFETWLDKRAATGLSVSVREVM